jgi:hypothetical protein
MAVQKRREKEKRRAAAVTALVELALVLATLTAAWAVVNRWGAW